MNNTSSTDLTREMEDNSTSVETARRKGKPIGAVIFRFAGAFVCLGIGILTWILMAESLQGLFKNYPKPYFLAYWIHSSYALLYVGWKIWREFPGNCSCNAEPDGTLHWKTVLWSSAVISVAGIASAYFWYLSLTRTSVPANTAVYQSCVAFVFVLSVPILRERVTIVKVCSVLFAIGGVTLISIFSEQDKSSMTKNTPLGYVYLVLSTVLYAVLEVLFKKFASIKDDTSPVCNSFRFVGIMGIHTLLWMWIPLVVFHFTIEPFELPSLYVLKLMFVNAIMDVIFNAAVFLCIALSSPLFTSVGVVTAIPLSVLVDFIIHKKTSGYQVYIGMLLIVIGFIGFCVSEIVASKREHNEKNAIMYSKPVVSDGNVHTVVTTAQSIQQPSDNENTHLLTDNNQSHQTTPYLIKRFSKYIL